MVVDPRCYGNGLLAMSVYLRCYAGGLVAILIDPHCYADGLVVFLSVKYTRVQKSGLGWILHHYYRHQSTFLRTVTSYIKTQEHVADGIERPTKRPRSDFDINDADDPSSDFFSFFLTAFFKTQAVTLSVRNVVSLCSN